MLRSVLSKIWSPRYYAIKSFSYFLPAPPKRASGYQEKEFDRIVSHLCSEGFELLDMNVQSLSIEEKGGVWVFCRMGALTKEAASKNINIDYQDIAGQASHDIPMHPDIVHER